MFMKDAGLLNFRELNQARSSKMPLCKNESPALQKGQ